MMDKIVEATKSGTVTVRYPTRLELTGWRAGRDDGMVVFFSDTLWEINVASWKSPIQLNDFFPS